MAEGGVRLDGVHALVLEVVRVELVEQADAASLLVPYVEDHASSLFGDAPDGCVELCAAVAAQAAEDVAGEAFGVRS